MTFTKQHLVAYERMSEYVNLESEGPMLKIVEEKLPITYQTSKTAQITPYNSLENNNISVDNLSVRYREDLP